MKTAGLLTSPAVMVDADPCNRVRRFNKALFLDLSKFFFAHVMVLDRV